MSILRTLNTGAAGIRSHGEALQVTGDNIANVNTVGFKRQRANFQDVLGRSVAGSGAMPKAGAGSAVNSIQQMWAQGALLTTDSPTDLAINGNGFFTMRGQVGGIEGQYYTRAGQFSIDNEGFLQSTDGLRLQGFPADGTGAITGALGDLEVQGMTITANPSTEIDLSVNLSADDPIVATPFDVNDVANTANTHRSDVTVYDSLGNAREITVRYRKTAADAWEWHATIDGGELTGGAAGTPVVGATGTLTFDTQGRLLTETGTATTWDFDGAAAGQAINFDFGDSITTDGGTGLEGSTSLAATESSNNAIEADGNAGGVVAAIQIDQDGVINGAFSNGQRRVLGQVAITDFASEDGLERAGQGFWVETGDSGQPLIGNPRTGGRGSIVAGALEASNVDLGQEFVDLIAYQRGFSANSRIVTTADEVYAELVNLKR